MKSILLIIPYFGKWPLWFDSYLISIAENPTIHWLCPTDCKIPQKYPGNIKFLPFTLTELNKHVNTVVGVDVPLNPRKFCDLKPAYGEIFAEEVKYYDFWGFCDMDIVWGDIRKYMTTELLNTYDIISSRKENISGHFTLFKNNEILNSLYKKLPNYKELFRVPEFKWTDEKVLSEFLKNNGDGKFLGLRVYWDTILCNQERGIDSHQEYHLDRWRWKNGKVLNTKTGEEVMYLHFINWKRSMNYSKVQYEDNPQAFYISYNGMHYKPHKISHFVKNNFKNTFYGYYINEWIRKQRKRLKKNRFKKIYYN